MKTPKRSGHEERFRDEAIRRANAAHGRRGWVSLTVITLTQDSSATATTITVQNPELYRRD